MPWYDYDMSPLFSPIFLFHLFISRRFVLLNSQVVWVLSLLNLAMFMLKLLRWTG